MLTGQIGKVLDESAKIALSWIKAHAQALQLESPAPGVGAQQPDDHHDMKQHHTSHVSNPVCYDLHLHLPAGAVPKVRTCVLVEEVSYGHACSHYMLSCFARELGAIIACTRMRQNYCNRGLHGALNLLPIILDISNHLASICTLANYPQSKILLILMLQISNHNLKSLWNMMLSVPGISPSNVELKYCLPCLL